MAKRKNRKPKRRSAAAMPSDPEAILKLAEGQLAGGNPKRAREGFRRLFKMDPDRYGERYIEVTSFVIEECLAAGRAREARQLLEHLESVGAPASRLGAIRVKTALALGESGAAVEAAVTLLREGSPAEQIAAADILVLAKTDQAAAITAGIRHLCRREWEAMREVLEGIGRKSPFAPWRLFLRGCAAFYRGDPEEAKRCFSRLPEGSVPARKSRAFEVLGGRWQGVEEGTIADACWLSGEPELATVLPAAQQKWLSGRHLDSYKSLKRTGHEFPCLEVSPWGQLTRLFLLVAFHLPPREGRSWLNGLYRLLKPRGGPVNGESYLVSGAVLRQLSRESEDRQAANLLWPIFIASREKLLGTSPRFLAMCHLTRALDEKPFEPPPHPFFWRPRAIRAGEFDGMIRALKASMTADSTFLEAPLILLGIYRRLNRHSDANRLLDEMTEQFPDSKEVLLAAGKACLDRKAFAKGLKYLERAREVAPIDPEIQAETRRAWREKAAADMRKGGESHLAKGRKGFEKLLASVPHHPGVGEGRGFILIEWSVLEAVANGPDAPEARERFAEAERDVPPDVAQFYRAMLAQRHGRVSLSGKRKSRRKFLPAPQPGKADLSQGLLLFELFVKFDEDCGGSVRASAINWIDQYLSAATHKLRREDRNLVLQLVNRMDFEGEWGDFAAELVAKQLKLDAKDPHFLCLAWICGERPPPDATHLRNAREEAIKRHDRAALHAINQFDEHQSRRTGPFQGDPFDDIALYEEFDEEEEEEEEEFPDFGDLDAALEALPGDLLEEVCALSHAQRVVFLMGQGIARDKAEALSEVLAVADGVRKAAGPQPPSRKGASPREKASPLDTFQLDLFS